MATTYTVDILPLFRANDEGCMDPRGIHLENKTWMCDPSPTFGFPDHGNARRVFQRVGVDQDMPPDGPWPAAWIATYQTWMNEGFQP